MQNNAVESNEYIIINSRGEDLMIIVCSPTPFLLTFETFSDQLTHRLCSEKNGCTLKLHIAAHRGTVPSCTSQQ